MSGTLNGIRIVDLTTVILGPWATQMLGDMGADVIKVETPHGDTTRHVGPKRNAGMASLFMTSNRNKRSVVLDLSVQQGRDALLRITDPTIRFSNNPSDILRLQPRLGEHSREILTEAGYSAANIAKLIETGVSAEPAS